MKYIIGLIKPGRLDEVREAPSEPGVAGMTVAEVKGFGRQKDRKELYRGAEFTVDFPPKIRIDVAVDDAPADRVVTTTASSAKTGKIGDGKIFVLDLPEAVRIRTGEAGSEAL